MNTYLFCFFNFFANEIPKMSKNDNKEAENLKVNFVHEFSLKDFKHDSILHPNAVVEKNICII